MTNKTIYLQGKSHYIRPYLLDTGENLDDGSDIKRKLLETQGVYRSDVILPFNSRDDAEEHLNALGIPTQGMMGNLLKRDKETRKVFYKIKRPHFEPKMPNKDTGEMGVVMGPPRVVDSEGNPWDDEILIGNGSDITVRLNVWQGDKITKIRWDAVRVDTLVEFSKDGGF